MLQGDVHSLNFATILQDLAADEKSGVLTLSQGERHLHVSFERGLIRQVGLPGGRGPSIPRGLVAIGVLAAEDLPEPGPTARQERTRVLRLLRECGIGEDLARQGLVHQMTEHLCEALVWSPATFRFDEGDAPDAERFDLGQADWGVVLSGEALMMEALRRSDEMEEAKKSLVPASEILVPTDAPLPEDADEATARLLEEINGEYSIAELMDRTHLGPFAVFKSVGILQAAGCVKSLSLDEVLQRARRHVERKDHARALRLCEYGLEREPSRLELRELAARCLHAAGDTAKAVAELRRLAAHHFEEGRPEEALACHRRILELAPDDIDAHERCLRLLLDQGDHAGARAAYGGLARAAAKAGLPDKVRDASAMLLDEIGEDDELLEQLADLQLQLGQRKAAAELYHELLQGALKGGRDEAALRFGRALLKFRPKSKELRAILARLQSGEHLRQRIHRRLRRLKFAGAGLVLVLLTAGGYEFMARRDLSGARARILDATMDGRLEDALGEYAGFLDRWSFSWVRREVMVDRAQLEQRYAGLALEEAAALHDQGQLVPALERLAGAADRLHGEAFRRVDEQRVAWQAERVDREAELAAHVQELAAAVAAGADGEAAQSLGSIADPLAVPALRALLGHEAPRVRWRAAVSLGLIGSFDAGMALLTALGDGDADVQHAAREQLGRIVGRDLGADTLAWHTALHDAFGAAVPAARVQAVLGPTRLAVAWDAPLDLSWSVTNRTDTPFTLTFSPPAAGITVLDGAGAPIPADGPDGAAAVRTVELWPGEHYGGVLDPSLARRRLREVGRYRLFWRPSVEVDGRPLTLDAAPVVIQILAPEERSADG